MTELSDHLTVSSLEEPSLKKELLHDAVSWGKTILFAVVFAIIINNFIIVNASVPTGSMESTIRTGDRIMALRLAYLFTSPDRYDIIVFRGPDDREILYVKRVIGLPGDVVNIRDGHVFINDSALPLRSDFVQGIPFGNFGPYYVPENGFFVLGDNRGNSVDSRHWQENFVSRDAIMGRVMFSYWPAFRGLWN